MDAFISPDTRANADEWLRNTPWLKHEAETVIADSGAINNEDLLRCTATLQARGIKVAKKRFKAIDKYGRYKGTLTLVHPSTLSNYLVQEVTMNNINRPGDSLRYQFRFDLFVTFIFLTTLFDGVSFDRARQFLDELSDTEFNASMIRNAVQNIALRRAAQAVAAFNERLRGEWCTDRYFNWMTSVGVVPWIYVRASSLIADGYALDPDQPTVYARTISTSLTRFAAIAPSLPLFKCTADNLGDYIRDSCSQCVFGFESDPDPFVAFIPSFSRVQLYYDTTRDNVRAIWLEIDAMPEINLLFANSVCVSGGDRFTFDSPLYKLRARKIDYDERCEYNRRAAETLSKPCVVLGLDTSGKYRKYGDDVSKDVSDINLRRDLRVGRRLGVAMNELIAKDSLLSGSNIATAAELFEELSGVTNRHGGAGGGGVGPPVQPVLTGDTGLTSRAYNRLDISQRLVNQTQKLMSEKYQLLTDWERYLETTAKSIDGLRREVLDRGGYNSSDTDDRRQRSKWRRLVSCVAAWLGGEGGASLVHHGSTSAPYQNRVTNLAAADNDMIGRIARDFLYHNTVAIARIRDTALPTPIAFSTISPDLDQEQNDTVFSAFPARPCEVTEHTKQLREDEELCFNSYYGMNAIWTAQATVCGLTMCGVGSKRGPATLFGILLTATEGDVRTLMTTLSRYHSTQLGSGTGTELDAGTPQRPTLMVQDYRMLFAETPLAAYLDEREARVVAERDAFLHAAYRSGGVGTTNHGVGKQSKYSKTAYLATPVVSPAHPILANPFDRRAKRQSRQTRASGPRKRSRRDSNRDDDPLFSDDDSD